jgi:hypothetical protein
VKRCQRSLSDLYRLEKRSRRSRPSLAIILHFPLRGRPMNQEGPREVHQERVVRPSLGPYQRPLGYCQEFTSQTTSFCPASIHDARRCFACQSLSLACLPHRVRVHGDESRRPRPRPPTIASAHLTASKSSRNKVSS